MNKKKIQKKQNKRMNIKYTMVNCFSTLIVQLIIRRLFFRQNSDMIDKQQNLSQDYPKLIYSVKTEKRHAENLQMG